MEEMDIMDTSHLQKHDVGSDYRQHAKSNEWSRDHVGVFIESFEETKRRKRQKNTTAVDILMSEDKV